MSWAKHSVVPRLLLFAVLLPCCCTAPAQTVGSISGSVHAPDGAAMPGVVLTLSREPGSPNGTSGGTPAQNQSAPVPLHATTDALGAYRFEGVAFGHFHLASDRPADTLSPQADIAVTEKDPERRLDLTLTRPSAEADTKPALQLQAAGIRGYIDPGGYSAAASAAAASDLIRGAADLNRPTPDAASPAGSSACASAARLLQATRDHPQDPHASLALGQFYLARHQPQLALAPLERARLLHQSDPAAAALLAEALLENKQFQAAHDLLASSAAQPASATQFRMLARSEEGLEEFAQAARDYQAAAGLEPTEADFYGAGYELLLAGQPAAASKAFLDGTARYPDSTMLWMGVGTSAFLEGRAADATRIFLKVATLHASDPRPYPFLSASSGISDIEPDAVVACFRRFHEASPSSAEAAYFYAESLLHHAATGASQNQVQSLLEQAVRLKPDFAQAHAALGAASFSAGDFNRAAAEFVEALRLDGELWEVRYKLSAAYRRAGKPQQADEQMRLFLAQKSRNRAAGEASGIQLDQFLSVFRQPDAPATAQPSCAAQP